MPPMEITVVPVTPFAQNASIVRCSATKRTAIVDPGGDLDRIHAALAGLDAIPAKILLTHGHIDHAGAAAEFAEALSLPIEGPHEADRFLLDDLPGSGASFGIPARAVTPGRWLVEGDTVKVGDLVLDVLHVPGHTPGHVVFVHEASRFAIVGDTLFRNSVGRTDFAYADGPLLLAGIKAKLLPLGDDYAILPGHGQATTIGAERANNPFIR